ncbi:MAG: DUF983 domain-containing protein [Opitutaceae bacterium]
MPDDGEPRWTVSRARIVARGLKNRCPNCGGRTLFKPGTLFQINPTCPVCGLDLERDEGSFLGSMSLNYGVTIVGYLLPLAILAFNGVVGGSLVLILAIAGALLVPALLYRSSRSWWLMNYYFFLPQHLPANRRTLDTEGDDNT